MQHACRHRYFRGWEWVAGPLAVVFATPAGALTTGIAGFSGQQSKFDGTPLYCSTAGTGCHFTDPGTKPPLVRFEGPTRVDPGAQTTYIFVVTSQNPQVQTQAGLDVAASGGTLSALPGQQEQVCSITQPCPPHSGTPSESAGEITHTGPKDNDRNGEASWEFTWTAPATAGMYVLFGAGNSVDGSTTFEGDEAAITTLMITVPCAGDCNGDGAVTVNELVLAANIALGTLPTADCLAADTDESGTISINELIAAVNKALNGC